MRRIDLVQPLPELQRMPSPVPRIAAILPLLALAACSRAPAGGAAFRDPASAQAPEWSVASRPSLTIGREDAGEKEQLFNVLAAVRRPDGAVVLGDGTGELRFFDARGRFVRAVGRKGRGPGEFQLPRRIVRIRGDSLAVWDGTQGRLTVYDSAGALGRMLQPPIAAGYAPDVAAVFAGGGMMAEAGSNARAMLSRSGVYPDSAAFTALAADGSPLRTLGRFAAGEVYIVHAGGAVGWNTLPFGRELFHAGAPDAFYLADSGSNRITVWSPSGRLIRSLEGPFAPRAVSGADLRRLRRERLEEISDAARRALVARGLAEAPVPRRTPAMGALAVDADGRLWVQEFPHPGSDDAHWAVLAADGRVAARVRMPRGWWIYEIGRDYLLVGDRDENDVEQVKLFALRHTRRD